MAKTKLILAHVALILAHVAKWLFKLLTIVLLSPIYVSLIAGGFRILIPEAGRRLSRVPFLSFLDNYEATHRLDLAHIMGFVLLMAVWLSWEVLLAILLEAEIKTWGFNPDKYKKFIIVLATTLVVSDACCFFMAVSQSSWGGGGSWSFAAAIATVAYVAILVSVSFLSCILSRNIKLRSQQLEAAK